MDNPQSAFDLPTTTYLTSEPNPFLTPIRKPSPPIDLPPRTRLNHSQYIRQTPFQPPHKPPTLRQKISRTLIQDYDIIAARILKAYGVDMNDKCFNLNDQRNNKLWDMEIDKMEWEKVERKERLKKLEKEFEQQRKEMVRKMR